MNKTKIEFIEFMAKSGVLTFGDFVTKSGRPTPYFINTGNYRTGAAIARLGDAYAESVKASGAEFDAMFGPAYKGIPLVAATAGSMWRLYGDDVPYSFNRKEKKDHGEGGEIVGYKPKDGDRIAIIEDVVTAGTAVRETIEFFKSVADVKLVALFVSVDRREKGKSGKSALDELREETGMDIFPIVTVYDIIEALHNREVDGVVYINDEMKEKMLAYLSEYGAD